MKKGILIFGIIVAFLSVFWFWPSEPKTKIYIPVTVKAGDTLESICRKAAKENNDTRDIREIVYYAAKQNSVKKFIHPGDQLVIEIFVDPEVGK